MIITPICAHDVQSRPIVTSDRRVISVRLERSGKQNAFLPWMVDARFAWAPGTWSRSPVFLRNAAGPAEGSELF